MGKHRLKSFAFAARDAGDRCGSIGAALGGCPSPNDVAALIAFAWQHSDAPTIDAACTTTRSLAASAGGCRLEDSKPRYRLQISKISHLTLTRFRPSRADMVLTRELILPNVFAKRLFFYGSFIELMVGGTGLEPVTPAYATQ